MMLKLQNLQDAPASESLGLFGAYFLDSRGRLEAEAMVLEKGKIKSLGPLKTLKDQSPDIPWIDAEGFVIHPGFVNGHTHVAMSFLREMAHLNQNMIEDIFFPLESRLTPELIGALAYPSIVMGLKSGVTCFFDHYYHIEAIAQALEKFKVRGVVAETLADLGGAMPEQASLERARNLVANWPFSDRVQPALGPHAMDTVSDELAKEIVKFQRSSDLPIHMHLSQTKTERERTLSRWSASPVERAQKLGLLGDHTLAVHLISAEDRDWKILKEEGTHIGLCPSSQILYEKLVDLKSVQGHGLRGVLGTDCAASHDSMDIWSELRMLHLLARQSSGKPQSALETLKTVWDHPAQWSGLKIGRLKEDYEADLAFTPLSWELAPVHDLSTHLILSMSSRSLKHLMVQGRWVLWEQEPVALPTSSWKEEYRAAVEALRPHMKSAEVLFPVLD